MHNKNLFEYKLEIKKRVLVLVFYSYSQNLIIN
jgi:hypothetical protein